MTVPCILKMGTSSLYERSQEVTRFACKELYELIAEMKAAMEKYRGVGIAAPQIGCNQRVILFGFEQNPRYPTEKPVPLTVLINPELEFLDEHSVEGWEGCLSVPGLRGLVARFTRLKYRGYDAEGKPIERAATGFHARVVQHECDHIDGVLFPLRIRDLHQFGFEEVLWDRIYPGKPRA